MNIQEFYRDDGSPIRCWRCYSSLISSVNRAYCAEVACEIDYYCKSCKELLAFWAYGGYDPIYREHLVDNMDSLMNLQSKEFDAAENLAKLLKTLQYTPVIDDDYPRVRHEYESALADFIQSMKDNGRFVSNNRYGLKAVREDNEE